jgi:hypothetical protein
LSPIALDVAEYELIEREREAREPAALPLPQALSSEAAVPLPAEDDRPARDWLAALQALSAVTATADCVPDGDFARSAYRFSLLGLLGDPGAEAHHGVGADIARVPLRWRTENVLDPVGRAGVAAISRGALVPAGIDDPHEAREAGHEAQHSIAQGSGQEDSAAFGTDAVGSDAIGSDALEADAREASHEPKRRRRRATTEDAAR